MLSNVNRQDDVYDLLIIGGGINGAGIACDAAGRGLKTALLESSDFASGTSSRSSKLIHGGLRYLEYYDFGLVRESLKERERLMNKAHHIAWPLRFVMPVVPGNRPAWLVRLGLFLYDHLASRQTLKGTETIKLSQEKDRLGFKDIYKLAFVYSDCWVDDARLVIANLQGARAEGAHIFARTSFEQAKRDGDGWLVTVFDNDEGCKKDLRTRIIVNAAGPWAVPIAKSVLGEQVDYTAKLVRGSHIIVPKLYDAGHATMLQIKDGRIVVTMPYENDYTLIGTTDHEYKGDPRQVEITQEEKGYLLEVANSFFQRQTNLEDIVWTYSGVRPLFEEGKSRDTNPTTVTRDYSFKLNVSNQAPPSPFLTVLGGKLTTYRRLSDHIFKDLKPYLPATMGSGKTKDSYLPGGNIQCSGPVEYGEKLKETYPQLPHDLLQRLSRTYGTLVHQVLGQAKTTEDLGPCFGGNIYAREVDYLIENEWAATVDDVLWRRTKCGLQFSQKQIEALSQYIQTARSPHDRKEQTG